LRVLLLPQHYVKFACSEEVPEPVDLQGSGFSVAFDPLDGSSIVDTNFTVGTIFGIWPGDKLTGITGRDQVMRFSVSSSTCILTSHHILAACCSSE
jgi:fructose-1,6-bisphosphatase